MRHVKTISKNALTKEIVLSIHFFIVLSIHLKQFKKMLRV